MANRTIRGYNDGNGNGHTIVRIFQILTLIPAWAILAAVMDHFNRRDVETPGEITFLFVVTLLASVWAFCVLITFHRAKNTALWMTFFDVVAMALLIASVIVISDIANVECVAMQVTQVQTPPPNNSNTDYIPDNWNPDEKWWNTKRWLNLVKRVTTEEAETYRKHCGNIKAAWGLAIANIIFFLITAILTAMIYKSNREPPVVREKIIVEQPPMHAAHPSVVPPPPPPPVFQDPYYDSQRRHSRGHRSHRSHRSHGSHSRRSSHPDGSYYEGSRRGSLGPDYYV